MCSFTANYEIKAIFGIMVEKGSELPEDDDRRKFKSRVVYQGNNVIDENWQILVNVGKY